MEQITSFLEPILEDLIPKEQYDSLQESYQLLLKSHSKLRAEMQSSKEAFLIKRKQWHDIKKLFLNKPVLSKIIQKMEINIIERGVETDGPIDDDVGIKFIDEIQTSTPLRGGNKHRKSDSSPLFLNSHSMNSSQVTIKREESSPFLNSLDSSKLPQFPQQASIPHVSPPLEQMSASHLTKSFNSDERNSDLLKDLADDSLLFSKNYQRQQLPSSPDISKGKTNTTFQCTPDGFWEINFTPTPQCPFKKEENHESR